MVMAASLTPKSAAWGKGQARQKRAAVRHGAGRGSRHWAGAGGGEPPGLVPSTGMRCNWPGNPLAPRTATEVVMERMLAGVATAGTPVRRAGQRKGQRPQNRE